MSDAEVLHERVDRIRTPSFTFLGFLHRLTAFGNQSVSYDGWRLFVRVDNGLHWDNRLGVQAAAYQQVFRIAAPTTLSDTR